jgi:O-antigen/teichoic acid export membrane protein
MVTNKVAVTAKRLVLNVISNIISLVMQMAVGFFMVPFFMHTLGKERYGIWILLASVFAYRSTLNMGLNSAINRYIPVFLAKNDKDGVQKVISMSTLYLCFTAIVLAGITLVVRRYVEVWFSIPSDLIGVTKTLVLIVGFCFVLVMPLQMYSGVLSGLQRYDIDSIGTIISLIIRTGLLILLLSRGYGLLTMGLVFGICEIATRIFQAVLAMKLLPHISMLPKKIDFSLFWQMLHYGANTLLYTLGTVIVCKVSDIIIGIFLTTADITKYYVASAGVLAIGAAIETFTAAIKPAISDLDARNKKLEILQVAFLTQKYVLILLIPSMFFFLIMGRDFLQVWAGADFGKLHLILILLAIGHFFRLLQYSNFLVLVGKGQHRIFGILAALMAVFTIVLAVVFVKTFKLGLVGIALSNLLSMFLICGLVLPIYFNYKMNTLFVDYVYQVWRPALASCVPSLLFMGVWKYYHSPDCRLHLATVVICVFIITMVDTWLWGLSSAEKKRFQGIMVGWKKKVFNKIPQIK